MAHITPEQEQQIWQRVAAQPDSRARNLEPMIRLAAEQASAYRNLAHGSTGKAREQLLQLMESEKTAIAALQGIRILDGDRPCSAGILPPERTPRARTLAQCIRRSRELCVLYASHMADGDFWPVFQTLADRQQHSMTAVLALLGNFPHESQKS